MDNTVKIQIKGGQGVGKSTIFHKISYMLVRDGWVRTTPGEVVDEEGDDFIVFQQRDRSIIIETKQEAV